MPSPSAMLLVVLAVTGDPETPKGDCAEYVANYRRLLQERAKDEATEQPDAKRGAPVVLQLRAEEHAGRVFEAEAQEVRASCERADRSQYECVVDAATYGDLFACRAPALPLLDAGVKVTEVRPRDPPREPDPAAMLQQFVEEGELEAVPAPAAGE